FISNNPYTQQFDRDIAAELLENNQAKQVVVIGNQAICDELSVKYADRDLLQLIPLPSDLNAADDVLLAPLCVLVSQLIGLCVSVTHDTSPDNPCPTGEVNRVVQGVTLYEFKG
ncbi:MAG: sugar isomerase, partial [Gammaproteobacteria bacterium]|nr:sugar isomerase [Gammaproteobacteria bacterium]